MKNELDLPESWAERKNWPPLLPTDRDMTDGKEPQVPRDKVKNLGLKFPQ